MSIRDKLLGLRWSLHIVHEGEILYAMHDRAVANLVGYVVGYFADGDKPVPPWSLSLHFNKNGKTFVLRPEHFRSDGDNVTDLLVQEIAAIDPKWRVPAGEPIFEEFATRRQIKISDSEINEEYTTESLQRRIDNMGKPKEPTFFSIINQVFGKG